MFKKTNYFGFYVYNGSKLFVQHMNKCGVQVVPLVHNCFHCTLLTQNSRTISRNPKYTQTLLQSYIPLSSEQHFATLNAPFQRAHGHISQYHQYSTDSKGRPQDESLLRKGWTKISTAVKTFMLGTKALYKDVKHMYDIRSKQGNYVLSHIAPREYSPGKIDFPLSRDQLVFSYNTRKHLFKMLPTVALFFVPFFGYFVPLVVFMYPQTLLSHHFWTDKQKVSFSSSRSRESMIHLRGLMGEVRVRASEEQMDLLSTIGRQLTESTHECDWTDVHSLIQEKSYLPFEMRRLPVAHMSLLCKGWNLRVLLPLETTRHKAIEKHMYYLYTCDWLIVLEGGVEKLTEKELLEACIERNLTGVDPTDIETLKRKLHTWVLLSTGFTECPVSLLAHLPMTQYLSDIKT